MVILKYVNLYYNWEDKEMKRTFIAIISFIMILLLSSCASSGGGTTSTTTNAKQLTKEEFEQLYTDANKFKGDKVDFYGKIFTDIERDDKGTYIQAFAGSKGQDNNILIAINDPNIDLKENDIIHVVGTVEGEQKGTNAFGAELKLPYIIAEKIEKSDYATAFSPALKTINLNQELNHSGYLVKISKIEFAKEETRVYISITNNMKYKINYYTFNSKAVQGSKQFETADNYDADYPQPQNEIMPGIKTEGILLFPAMDSSLPVKFIMEGSSDNYEIQINPFIFEVKQNK